jgi:hypothetical protein
MKDSDILNWLEKLHAQVWWDGKRDAWTCQIIVGGKVIQPTRHTMREAVEAAETEYAKLVGLIL